MAKGDSAKLKDQNRRQLWLVIAINAVVVYAVSQWAAIQASGLTALAEGAVKLLPVGLAVIVATVANGILSSAMKDRLVFLRWRQALPGHRAFSVHAPADPRIDPVRLKRCCGNKLPADADVENRLWYRFYLEVQNVPAVEQVHRDYLLLRDYTGLAALFLVGFGIADPILLTGWKTLAVHQGALLVQFVAVRHAAMTYGIRFVCTVLAQKTAKMSR